MSVIEKVEREIAESRELRRALCRWVAAIREMVLKKMTYDKTALMVVLEADLRQCERMLISAAGIDYDPVLEIWREDGERHGVYWNTFKPKAICFDCERFEANGFSGRCLACTLKHQASCEHKHWDTGLDSCLDCGGGSTRK